MFTVTADLTLPSTVTGSFPRPRWFDVSMWGRSLDTCMLDVRFREKFQDALAVVICVVPLTILEGSPIDSTSTTQSTWLPWICQGTQGKGTRLSVTTTTCSA